MPTDIHRNAFVMMALCTYSSWLLGGMFIEKNSHKVAVADEVKLVDVAITISRFVVCRCVWITFLIVLWIYDYGSSIQWMSTVKGTCVRARIFPSPDTLKQLILRKRDIHVKV